MIRGAIFDFDGTLVDSNPYWDMAPVAWLASLGKEAQPDLGATLFAMTVPEASAYLISTYHLTQTPEEIKHGINAAMQSYYLTDVPLKPGVTRLLQAFRERNIPCAIASVTDEPLVTEVLQKFGLLSCFSAIVSTDMVGVGKNKPDIYFRAAELLGSSPAETLVFEDAFHALSTAKRAGFRTVGVFDTASAERQDEIQNNSDYYLLDFSSAAELLFGKNLHAPKA